MLSELKILVCINYQLVNYACKMPGYWFVVLFVLAGVYWERFTGHPNLYKLLQTSSNLKCVQDPLDYSCCSPLR